MKKTKEQILRDCTDEHDKKLLIEEFDRWEKTHNKSTFLMLIAILFVIIGIIGSNKYVKREWFNLKWI